MKDKGKPLSAIFAGVNAIEKIVNIFSIANYDSEEHVFFATRTGQIKRTKLSEYDVRNKKIAACGLGDKDLIISVNLQHEESDWLVITQNGMGIRFSSADVSSMGRSAKGCEKHTA